MQEISKERGLAIAAQALIVERRVSSKRYPVLAEVMALDTQLGSRMGFLGYSEFTPALLKAMVLKKLDGVQYETSLLKSESINNFLRSTDAQAV